MKGGDRSSEATCIEHVLVTEELTRRTPRPADFKAENQGLRSLAVALAKDPQDLLQELARVVRELCRADSACVSLLDPSADPEVFRWNAISGPFDHALGRALPRAMSPCEPVLEQDIPLLFKTPGRYFSELATNAPPIFEMLLVPFHRDGKPIGAVGALAHTPERRFDAEDARVLASLSQFASTGFQMAVSLDAARMSEAQLERQVRELTQTEAAHRESEERLRLISNQVPAMISYVDRDGVYRFNNKRYEEWLGIPTEQVTGRHIRDVWGEDTYKLRIPYFERVLRGEMVHFQGRVQHHRLGWRDMDGSFVPDIGDDGTVRGFYVLGTDITERVNRQANSEFLAELTSDFTQLSDPEEIMETVGEKTAKHLGVTSVSFAVVSETAEEASVIYDRHERSVRTALGTHRLSEYMTEEYLRDLQAGLVLAVDDITTDPRTAPMFGAYAEYNVRSQIHAPYLSEGRWKFLLTVQRPQPYRWQPDEMELMRELSARIWIRLERAWAGQALVASEERYRAIVECQAEMVCRFRPDGTILFVNGAYARARGTSPEALIGVNFWEFIEVEDHPAVRAMLDTLCPESPEVCIENRFDTAEGTRWTLWTNRALIFDAQGRPTELQSSGIDITARKQAEAKLRASEEQFRELADSAPVLIWMSGPNKEGVYFNQTWLDFTGQPLEAHLGEGWVGFIHEDDRQPLQEACLRAFNERRPFVMEFRLKHASGEFRWMLDTGTPRFINGAFEGFIGSCVDITESKLAQTAIQESEQRLRLAMRAAKMGAWEWNVTTNEVRWSTALEEIHGLTPGTFGGTFTDYQRDMHPEDRDRVLAGIQRTLRERTTYHVIYRIIRPNGDMAWLEARGELLLDRRGEPTKLIGVCADITDRKQAEQALRDSEERFRQLSDSMPQIVWASRPDGHIDYYNRKWYELTGAEEGLVGDESWLSVMHPDDRRRCFDAWYESVRTGKNYQVECRFKFAHCNEYHWHLGRALPVRDDSGRIVRWFGTCTDISEQKRTQKELQQLAEKLAESDRRKDEFLATLAHELRNPMAPIRTGLEIMKLALDDREMLEDVRNTMERQVIQLVSLVDDLLDVSRITRGKFQLRKCPIALADCIRSAVEASRPLINDANHQLTLVLPEHAVYLDADPNRLAQIFSNLLNNAAKYTPEGGQIWLTAEIVPQDEEWRGQTAVSGEPGSSGEDQRPALWTMKGSREATLPQDGDSPSPPASRVATPSFVSVTVKDNGIGIPAEMLEQIFEMFAQIERPMEQGYTGLGIGLTLVKSLVEMHGGRIQVHSAGHNQGSEFRVQLPILTEIAEGSEQTGPPNVTLIAESKRRVLVVDDNEAAAETLGTIVTMLGHDVQKASDGQEAVEVAAEFQPEVVLMDLGMPRMTGFEAARQIRQQPWGEKMLLVALSGWGQDEDKRRTHEAGFDHHLVKPADPAELQRLFAEMEHADTQ